MDITHSLCNPSQCLTEWENFSFMSSRNLLSCSGGLLPLILCCVTLGRFCLPHPILGSLKASVYPPFSCLFLSIIFAFYHCRHWKKLPVGEIPLKHKETTEEVTNMTLMKITHVQSSDISKLLPCGMITNIFPSNVTQTGHSESLSL